MTRILALGVGETGADLISSKVDAVTLDNGCNLVNGSKIHGIFLCVRISHFEKMCDIWKQEMLPTVNLITSYMHDIVM